ncbi:MAG TPA: GNAT family protein [Anaerolineaceae bacterium]|nr:GNAT family protein [Anaerolineaceae bacterium]
MSEKIVIKETSKEDLDNILLLWSNGEVMSFVGFPNGLEISIEKLLEWLPWAISKPTRCHYSIYYDEIGYCGETFYNVDHKHGLATLDIKLLPNARGKGIAEYSLRFAIDQAFHQGNAEKVYVDPHRDNKKAWKLYEKLGFSERSRPEFLDKWDTYLELSKDEWLQRKINIKTTFGTNSS